MNEIETNEDMLNLTKSERRKRKKDLIRLARKKARKIESLKKWALALGGIIIIIGSLFFLNQANEKHFQDAPEIQITPNTYNFRKVPASEGVAKTNFEIKNTGASKLTISGMETSCGCTTASIEKDEQAGPVFGMHDNPTNWSVSIEPDQTATLTVFFDPNFHRNASGPVTRTISIFSDDPRKSKKDIIVNANIQR